jgi:Fe2+ transport system protein FeoA
MTIAMMREGDEFIVERLALNRETGKRLADMGFTQGAVGYVVRRGFFGGPLQIRLGECDVMIRASEAAGIDVLADPGRRHHRHRFGRKRGHGSGCRDA